MTDAPETPLGIEAVTADDGLSSMQRDFCNHALDLIGEGEKWWRKKAAERAGYKDARGSASDLIRMPKIIDYITKRLTEATESVNVDPTFILFRAMANMATCEAAGDFRTAHRYLETIRRHLIGLSDDRGPGGPAHLGTMSLPFDPSKLSGDELATMISLMRKAGGGPTE